MNIPRQIELYGLSRLYWEGGFRGEGIIQEIKRIINHGLVKNWEINTMKRFYNNRGLKFLREECLLNRCKQLEDNIIDNSYRRYGEREEIAQKFINHDVLSVTLSN